MRGSEPGKCRRDGPVCGASEQGASGVARGDCLSRAGSGVYGLHEGVLPLRRPLGAHGLRYVGEIPLVAVEGWLAHYLCAVTKSRP